MPSRRAAAKPRSPRLSGWLTVLANLLEPPGPSASAAEVSNGAELPGLSATVGVEAAAGEGRNGSDPLLEQTVACTPGPSAAKRSLILCTAPDVPADPLSTRLSTPRQAKPAASGCTLTAANFASLKCVWVGVQLPGTSYFMPQYILGLETRVGAATVIRSSNRAFRGIRAPGPESSASMPRTF